MEKKERMGAAACGGEESRGKGGGERTDLWPRVETVVEKWVSALLERADGMSHLFPKRLADWNHALGESMHKALERLNLPTKGDREATNRKIEEMAKQWREDLEEQIRKGAARLPFAARGSLENVAEEVRTLRGQVDGLLRSVKPGKKPAGPKVAEA